MKKIFYGVFASVLMFSAVSGDDQVSRSTVVSQDLVPGSDQQKSPEAVPEETDPAGTTASPKTVAPVRTTASPKTVASVRTTASPKTVAPAKAVVYIEKKHPKPEPILVSCAAERKVTVCDGFTLVISILTLLLAGGVVYLLIYGIKKINELESKNKTIAQDIIRENKDNVKNSFDTRDEQVKNSAYYYEQWQKAEPYIKQFETLAEAHGALETQANQLEADLTEEQGKHQECQKNLAAAQSTIVERDKTIDNLKTEYAALKAKADQLAADLTEEQGEHQECQKNLAAAQSTIVERDKTIDKFNKLIGNADKIMGGVPEDKNLQVIMLGVAKLQAMLDAGIAERRRLTDFKSFDSQMGNIIEDAETLQNLRNALKDFLKKCLPGYDVVWPAVGTNIAEYDQKLLDLGTEHGTTISKVKCAAISTKGEAELIQKANVSCK